MDVNGLQRRVRRRGYALAANVLSPEEVGELRNVAAAVMSELEGEELVVRSTGPEGESRNSQCDLLTLDRMRPVLLDPRVLSVVRSVLGEDPVYFGDSSLRIGSMGERAWHPDTVDRTREPYGVVRCGLYLQDHLRHSGGLAVRPYSNHVRPGLGMRFPPRLAPISPGDLVVWDLRLWHQGEAVRFRPAPFLPLPARLQSRLPTGLRVAEERERVALFMTFGSGGRDTDNFINYLKTRDYMRESWAVSEHGSEALRQAEEAGLKVLPLPDVAAQV